MKGSPHLKGVATLPCEILQKSCRLKAEQRHTKRVHSEENVTAVGELALSHLDQLQIYCFKHIK